MFDKINSKNDSWEAWIDARPPKPNGAGKLYVTGLVTTHPSKQAVLALGISINPKILVLEVLLVDAPIPTKQPQEVRYEQFLKETDQYEYVEIFYGGKEPWKSPSPIPIVH